MECTFDPGKYRFRFFVIFDSFFFFLRKLFSYSNIVEFHPFAYTHFYVIIFLNFFPEERGGGEKRETGYL